MTNFTDPITGGTVSIGTIQSTVSNVASQNGIPDNIFQRLIFSESSYNPAAYNSKYGATGIAQFLPSTAASVGVNPLDWQASLQASGKYLSDIYSKTGDWMQSVAIYKGKSGGADSQINYADSMLNQRPLTLVDGTVIPNASSGFSLSSITDTFNKLSSVDAYGNSGLSNVINGVVAKLPTVNNADGSPSQNMTQVVKAAAGTVLGGLTINMVVGSVGAVMILGVIFKKV